MNRRNFIKTTGLGTALTFLTGKVLSVENLFGGKPARRPEDLLESWSVSTCGGCSAGCGLRVRLIGGSIVGIKGNEENPVSRGGLCSRAFSGIQSLYNPDRLKGPLMRDPGDPSGNRRDVSWDEAMGELTRRLTNGSTGEHPIQLLTGEKDGLTVQLLARFVTRMGSGEVLYYPWGDSRMAHPAVHVSQGIDDPLVYDTENSTYILSFSNDFLQTNPSQVNRSRAFGRFRQGTSRVRGKLVHFEPRLSITASKADEWIAIKPGTEGAVALGIASTLLEEGLYNKRFVAAHCTGFDDWVDTSGNLQSGFRSTILDEFSPQKVSEITGVSPEVIIKVAREFAGASRPLALGCDRIDFSYQDIVTRLAIHSLNALAGNIDRKGGVIVPRKIPAGNLSDFPAHDSESQRTGKRLPGGQFQFPVSLYDTDSSLEQLLLGRPPEVLFVYAANPLFTSSRKAEWKKYIEGAGFVVCFSSFIDETSDIADLILPDSHYFEKWHERTTWTNLGYPVFSIAQPVIEPINQTRCTGDVVLELAGNILGDNDDFPWKNYRDVIKARVAEIHRARRGDVFGPPFEEMWVRFLERIGWRASSFPDFEAFWEKCVEKGGWWDPIYYYGNTNRAYKNKSGKFDFGIELVTARALHIGTIKRLYTGDRFDKRRDREASRYPFLLHIHSHYPLLEETAHNEPLLMELMTFQSDQSGEWRMWVEMNPEDADRSGLHHNDRVKVETPVGQIVCTLKLFAGNPPGTISLPFGLGRETGGRYVEGIGANPTTLVEFEFDRLTGNPTWDTTYANVTKAG